MKCFPLAWDCSFPGMDVNLLMGPGVERGFGCSGEQPASAERGVVGQRTEEQESAVRPEMETG